MRKQYFSILLAIAALFSACGGPNPESGGPAAASSWEATLAEAKGQQITMMMWQGDPYINKYMQEFVQPQVKQEFGIDLQIVPGQGNDIVSLEMAELEAGKAAGSVDVAWINGETFFQLRQIEALHGPFTTELPNSQYIDWENPFIGTDFQQKVEGFECPWGNVQEALIYNSEQVQNPPQTLEELEAFVKANPGKFTIGSDFTGMTLLKAMLANVAGGKDALSGPFDEEKYATNSKKLWEYLNRIKPHFWNSGKSFPADVAQMHQLFASGELWFTMSNNDSEVDNKIAQGLFPESSRAYVPSFGTIQNSHYLGILKNSGKKAAAKVFINFMISPAAQLKKLEPAVWGDGTILSMEKLPADWQQKFAAVPGRKYSPKRSEIQDKAIMEPAPEYMIRLFEDFRKEVMEK
jgi:putative spermidine/putrescine transport system substrate-binding protein